MCIGIFDSGLGGLTVAKEIFKNLPYERIVYLGDTAHLPYGSKSKEIITMLSVRNVEFLLKSNVKVIVIACNTASSLSYNSLKKKFDLPIINVIYPGAKAAVLATKNKKIGIIGTLATIGSGSYEKAIRSISSDIKVYSKACPLFVPLVEEGKLQDEITRFVVRDYLLPFKKFGMDVLILGCTHYPLLKSMIQEVMGKDVKLIDSASEVSLEVKRVLTQKNLLQKNKKNKTHKFFVTDFPQQFEKLGKIFLGSKSFNVKKVEI
ncbi:MAG: glutamate racemase [Candidatus Firestonebacteria bacterium]